MAGYKDFADGTTLPGDDLDGYLMRQSVMRFPTVLAALAALGAGVRADGMMFWADDTDTLYWWEAGTASWKPIESYWKAFATTWTGPSALAIGNGTLTCRWRYSGGMVVAHYELLRGSTTNAGSAAYAFTLPVEAQSVAGVTNWPLGVGLFRDSSPFAEYPLVVIPVSTTAIAVMVTTPANSRCSNTVPVAVATGDNYQFTVTYEPQFGVS